MQAGLSLSLISDAMGRCFGYWNGLRAGGSAPTLLELDPFFSSALTESAIAADVSGEPEDFAFWAVGDALLPYVTDTRPGRRFSELHGELGESLLWQAYAAVKTRGMPHFAAFDYDGPVPGIRSTRELFLPFRQPDTSDIGDVLTVVEFSPDPVPRDRLGASQRVPLPVKSRRRVLATI